MNLWPFRKKKSTQFSGATIPAGMTDFFGGETYVGGMSQAAITMPDYYVLRLRSKELFTKNLYAQGLINRIVLSKVSTGITIESDITDTISDNKSMGDLTDLIEQKFGLWAKFSRNCDYQRLNNFHELQSILEREAIIEGDALVVLHTDPKTNATNVELVPAGSVMSNFRAKIPTGNRVEYGVELDPKRRQVAFHVVQSDGSFKRIPAYGRKSGRKLAWMYYARGQRAAGAVRGTPLLGVIMQSLQELGKYRDAKVRSAVLNAMLAMWIEKTDDRPSSLPMSGAAIRKDTVSNQSDANTRDYTLNIQSGGLIVEELAKGEQMHPYQGNQAVEGYRTFEEAIVDAIAWCNQVPPEILKMSFNSNYSASQASKLEFVQTLRIWRETLGSDFCQPIYEDWLIGMALMRKLPLNDMLSDWRVPARYLEYSAWVSATWTGPTVPTVDLLKNTKAYALAVESNFMTHDRATKEQFGMKFAAVVKRLRKEREMLLEAGLLELPVEEPQSEMSSLKNKIEELQDEKIDND